MQEIEDITDQDLFSDDVVQAWQITKHFSQGANVQMVYVTINKDGSYFVCDEEGDEVTDSYKDHAINSVISWELKKVLKPDTFRTFNDIINEL